MSRKYSFTLSEDDFRKQLSQVESTQKSVNERPPSVVPALIRKYENEERFKIDFKKRSGHSSNGDRLSHQNSNSFNKTVRPRSKSQNNIYRRFSNSQYFNWDEGDDVVGGDPTTISAAASANFIVDALSNEHLKTNDERRECVLCQLARDAIEKEEKLKKEEMTRKTYQSEHCRQLDYFQKFFK